jgi:hypothetical protein
MAESNSNELPDPDQYGKHRWLQYVAIPRPNGASPQQFLSYAKEDLNSEISPRTLTNALGNAKRAISLHVESAACALGYLQLPRKKNKEKPTDLWLRQGLPAMLEFLTRCGIATFGITRRINHNRNLMEHDYVNPEEESVRDAVDTVDLFLRAMSGVDFVYPGFAEFVIGEEPLGPSHVLTSAMGSGEIKIWPGPASTLLDDVPGPNEECINTLISGTLPNTISPLGSVNIKTDQGLYYTWARALLGDLAG